VQQKTKERLNSIKSGVAEFSVRSKKYVSSPIALAVMVALIIALIYTLGLALATGGESLRSFLFGDANDYFMDFFNSMHDASFDDLYTVRHVIYPPFIEIFFRTITAFVPGGKDMSGMELRSNQTAVIIFVLIFAISLVILGVIIFLSKKGSPLEKLIFTVLIFFSLPVISIIDRGNIVVAAVAFAAVFVRYRNNKSAVVREIAYISLALASAIKLYPALLILLLLKDKNWWGLFRTAIYIFLLFFLPFFYFGNVSENLSAYMSNVLGWSSITAGEAVSAVGDTVFGNTENFVSLLGAKISTFGTRLLAEEVTTGEVISVSGQIDELYGTMTYTSTFQIFVAFLTGNYSALEGCKAIANVLIIAMFVAGLTLKDWRTMLVWSLLSIVMFKTSYTYSLCFIILPFTLFLNEAKTKNPVHWLYAVGFFFIFACFSTETTYWNIGLKGYSLRLGEFMSRIGILIITVLLIWEAFSRIIARIYMIIMLFITDRPAFKEKIKNLKAVKFVLSLRKR